VDIDMADFTIRAGTVNVEDIMRQIRARVREKRGVDYTEEQIQALASVKLEQYLDSDNVRSELLQQFKKISASPDVKAEEQSLFGSTKPVVRLMRRLLRPVLKLFINPDKLIQATRFSQHVELSYEVLHNLVLEMTRLGIDVKNLKMRVESVSSRLDFYERRARALEGIVQYRPGAGAAPPPKAATRVAEAPANGAREGDNQAGEARSRRRRRRRGRRGSAQPPQAAEHQDAAAPTPDQPAAAGPHAPERDTEPPRDPGAGADPGSGSPDQ
jgi:hypothetical protein